MLNISIIGFGRVGSHLYYALKKSGKVKVSVAARKSGSSLDKKAIRKNDIIFICTDDKNIANASKEVLNTKTDISGKIFFHTSGAKGSEVISELKTRGAHIGSFHPVQSFSSPVKNYSGCFKEIFVAVEGDVKASAAAMKIARLIKSKPFEISAQQKVFHHICSVYVSNYFDSLMAGAELLFDKTLRKGILKNGFNNTNFFDIYRPLIEQTLTNIGRSGAVKALTGPIERNDMDTLLLHLKALKSKSPELLPLYIIMGIETTKTALKKKSLTKKEALEIIKLFK